MPTSTDLAVFAHFVAPWSEGFGWAACLALVHFIHISALESLSEHADAFVDQNSISMLQVFVPRLLFIQFILEILDQDLVFMRSGATGLLTWSELFVSLLELGIYLLVMHQ